jgi:hypothetical protein
MIENVSEFESNGCTVVDAVSIPVKSKIDSPNWSAWSVKESVQFGRPPEFVLQSLVAVRVHLEDTGSDNGALAIVPGSHVTGESGGGSYS